MVSSPNKRFYPYMCCYLLSMCGASSNQSHICSYAIPFGVFKKCLVCPRFLDQFLLTRFTGFGEGKKPNFCGNVLPMPYFSAFGVEHNFHLASTWCNSVQKLGTVASLMFSLFSISFF